MGSPPAWQRNLRLLWAGHFLTTAGLTMMVPLLPFYMEELGAAADSLWSGLALAAPALTLMLVAPLWGWMGDRWGRKWMVVRALFGLALSLVLMAQAMTPLQFLVCRLLQGICGGVVDAAAAFVGAEGPPQERGRAMGSLQSATAAGALVGPLASGLLVDIWGLRPLLLIMGILTAFDGLVAIWLLRESGRRAAIVPNSTPLRQILTELLRHRQLRWFVLAGLWSQAGAYGLVIVFAPHVRELLSDPSHAATWVGLLQALTWGATWVGASWWGRRNDRKSVAHNFSWAAWGCAISIALQAWPPGVEWLFPLRIMQGFFFSALIQSVYLQVSRNTNTEQQGVQIGIANSFLVMGQVLGPLAASAVSGILSFPWIFALMGGFFGLSALLAWRSSHLPLEGRLVLR